MHDTFASSRVKRSTIVTLFGQFQRDIEAPLGSVERGLGQRTAARRPGLDQLCYSYGL